MKGEMMTVSELIQELMLQKAYGYGNKKIYVKERQEMVEIDSVQKDTNASVRANYLFLMSGVSTASHG